MQANAKISIAIAAYNGGKYIAEQLASLLAQTRLPDEIIICDDSADELTFQAVQEFLPCNIIRYTKNLEPLGVARNFEKALSLTSGEYIFLCDQDDVWLPGKVESLAAVLDKNKDIDGVFCNSILVAEKLEPLDKTLWELRNFTPAMQKMLAGGNALEVFCRRVVCSGHNIAVRRRALEYIMPFPELAPFYPDTWIALAVALNSNMQMCNELLTLYRIHNANRSNPAGSLWQSARRSRNNSAAARNSMLAEELLQRSIAADPARRKMVENFALHHRNRSLYSKNIFVRTGQMFIELYTFRYSKYSNGWRTFAADMIFR
ncbi:MAG: glycosyltransferase [Lentisphaeria bacterium]|nr:glycosyltransferase [Lentisphaeria bacterium]